MCMLSEFLPWDTELFGFPVYRLNVKSANLVDLPIDSELQLLANMGVKLIYVFSDKNLDFQQTSRFSMGFRSKKVGLTNSSLKPSGLNDSVVQYKHSSVNELAIKALVVQAGVHSRFNLDPMIPKHKFVRMYCEWIEKCISGHLADQVFVYKISGVIVGFISLKKMADDSSCSIVLISVDEAYRGQGIARALINSANHWARVNGCCVLSVSTQASNDPAISLYSHMGFKVTQQEYQLHLWSARP